jgi:tetratricopeptide (TPR) repeat protein
MEKSKQEANTEFKQGNYQGAVENFTECLGLDDLNDAYNATILYNRASAYHKLKDYKRAMEDCN